MDRYDHQIDRLRQWRGRSEPDSGLSFIADQFQREIARPHRQLAAFVEHWQELVPAELAAHTALRSFSRGTLRVAVADSATLYQLDRQLRGGLERELRNRCKSTLRRVKLELEPLDDPTGQ